MCEVYQYLQIMVFSADGGKEAWKQEEAPTHQPSNFAGGIDTLQIILGNSVLMKVVAWGEHVQLQKASDKSAEETATSRATLASDSTSLLYSPLDLEHMRSLVAKRSEEGIARLGVTRCPVRREQMKQANNGPDAADAGS